MSRRKSTDRAFAKALGLWEVPEGAGEPKACIATTFTFDATFFETECLGRFLGMDSHPAESDAVCYMVEREEKLAAARVAVLADRQHARDKESLRWDVLGVLVPGAIQHAKVSLLAWANHVRVIVGSGNLTEPGYRKNLEVFGAIDLRRSEGGDRQAVIRVLAFVGELVDFSIGTDAPNGPKRRAQGALQAVRALIARWPEGEARSRHPLLVLGGPGRSILPQVVDAWPSASPPRTAYVVSPFFDRDGTQAATALLSALAKRRPRKVFFDVRAEGQPDGRTRVFASLQMIQHAAVHADVTVRRVLPEQSGELRDLHAKMIYFANEDWSLVLAGSSNFTRAGLGANGSRNFEANLAYRVRASDPEAKVLDAIWPEIGEDLDVSSGQLIWDPQGEEEEVGELTIPLPAAFEEAAFMPGPHPSLAITLRDPLPEKWTILTSDGRELVSSMRGTGSGEHVIAWEESAVPFVLEVTWTHGKGTAIANWPVNVSNPAALPPPEALRSLTLEELLEILASTRPIPPTVADALAKRKAKKKEKGDPSLDPLKRFDSRSFLLRRTKRLAAALERLRDRLELPASSREAFEWRLSGPVGPLALADGYVRESSFPGEAKFCLAEIALALHRVRPERVLADGLPQAVVSECLKSAIDELAQRAAQTAAVTDLDRYANASFDEARR